MSTSSYLATLGVTTDQARAFLLGNLHDPQAIFNTARQFGVTNEMLGEITGYSATQVRAFFGEYGMVAGELDPEPLFPPDLLQFASIMALNTATGALSTASLRQQVIARTGEATYNMAFDPNQYAGGLDGIFSAADLGVASLGNLPATRETLESLFYGTIVRVARAVDATELQQLVGFLSARGAALDNDDPAAVNEFLALMQDVVADEGGLLAGFGESQIAEAAVGSAVALVGMASWHDQSLFDELLTGFVL